MTRKKQIQLELDYQDTYSDYIICSEMVKESKGVKRLALLKLRDLLKETMKVMKGELDGRN